MLSGATVVFIRFRTGMYQGSRALSTLKKITPIASNTRYNLRHRTRGRSERDKNKIDSINLSQYTRKGGLKL
jgi:hypothetical protein